MDKSTLSNYGWVVIVTLVLSVMLAFATPFGSYVAKATANVVKYYKEVTGDTFSSDHIDDQSEEWDNYLNDTITIEEINADPYAFAIGKTKPEYVVAKFSEDFSSARVFKNGTDSDGEIMHFSVNLNNSPFINNKATLRSVYVEDGVTVLGRYMLFQCYNIDDLRLPDSIKRIENYSLAGLTKLTELNIPKNTKYLVGHGIAGNTGLTKITVSKNCENFTVIDNVLYRKDLSEIVYILPSKQITSFEFYDTITNIGSYAFSEQEKLTSIALPEGIKRINHSAFFQCHNLKEVIMPSTVTYIDTYLFMYCESLETVVLSERLPNIPKATFFNCTSLKTITIPPSVAEIADDAFSGCTSLTTIKGKSGSAAETFAIANNYTFVAI